MARVRPRGSRRYAVRHVRRPSANFERLHALVHGPPKFPGRGCRRRSTQHTQENDITDNVGRPHRRATARQRHSACCGADAGSFNGQKSFLRSEIPPVGTATAEPFPPKRREATLVCGRKASSW